MSINPTPSTNSTHNNVLRRGNWQGCVVDGVAGFLGIRYGRLFDEGRPRSASIAASDQMIVEDMTEVPVFPQLPSRLDKVMGRFGCQNPQADDAFFLNVWTPEDAQNLPVMVFVHGGAWVTGGGAMRWYRGENLAREGMVVVTVNYRIGPAGHLAPDSDADEGGHRPFGDLLLVLRWVQDNISQLGGNPDAVTLAGQSAGAWYAWALSSLPEAAGLFQRAALFSIAEIRCWSAEERDIFTKQVYENVDQDRNDRDALMRAGFQTLGQMKNPIGVIPQMYMPMLTPEHAAILGSASSAAAASHVKATYVRTTRHESSVFLPWPDLEPAERLELLQRLRDNISGDSITNFVKPSGWSDDYDEAVRLGSWLDFRRFSGEIAKQASATGQVVTARDFAALSGIESMGGVHCIDLPFQFGNWRDWTDAPMLKGWTPEAFETVSATLRRDLADFVYNRQSPPFEVVGASAPQ